jgi:hypothetical protein
VGVFVQIPLTTAVVHKIEAELPNANGTIELVIPASHAPTKTPLNPAA